MSPAISQPGLCRVAPPMTASTARGAGSRREGASFAFRVTRAAVVRESTPRSQENGRSTPTGGPVIHLTAACHPSLTPYFTDAILYCQNYDS